MRGLTGRQAQSPYILYKPKNCPTIGVHLNDLVKLSTELNRELADGQAYFDAIAADERRWIADGVNVDQAFAAKYYDSLEGTIAEAEKQLASEWRDVRGNPYEEARNRALLVIGGILAGLGLFVWATRWTYRRINSRAS
ncbi:MAG TPA: hypothetical protein VHD36_05440 [Pirellulales bacterium]|nr:hypothetical protein [Pirellulales bacterium]